MELPPLAPCPCGRPPAADPPDRLQGVTAKRAGAAGKTLAYTDCCGRWHAGPAHFQAPDAESLMRSRYSAFVLGLSDYLLATWHPTTRPASLQPEGPELRWLGLTVRQHRQQDEDHASVAFVARNKQQGRAHRLEENSRFVREHEAAGPRWYYLDGSAGADQGRG